MFGSQQNKEKMIKERTYEQQLKHDIQDPLNEATQKLRLYFSKKLSKNLARVCEKQKSEYLKNDQSLASTDNFRSFHTFMGFISNGLKLHLLLNLALFDQTHKSHLEWYARSFQ